MVPQRSAIRGNPSIQYEELMLTRGFQSSSEARLHFGLDSATADSILIVWPDQKYQVIRNAAVNHQLEVRQSDATGHFDYEAVFSRRKSPSWKTSPQQIGCPWKHKENDFNDFSLSIPDPA